MVSIAEIASSGPYTTEVTKILSNGASIPFTPNDPGFTKPP